MPSLIYQLLRDEIKQIPLETVVIGHKYDVYAKMEPIQRKTIGRIMRYMSHKFGASLFLTTKNNQKVPSPNPSLLITVFSLVSSSRIYFSTNRYSGHGTLSRTISKKLLSSLGKIPSNSYSSIRLIFPCFLLIINQAREFVNRECYNEHCQSPVY
jgi:hypothetical protein